MNSLKHYFTYGTSRQIERQSYFSFLITAVAVIQIFVTDFSKICCWDNTAGGINTRIVAKIYVSMFGRNVIALYSDFIGNCPLSEAYLTCMTFQELAILSSLGSHVHLYSLMQPTPVSLMPRNVHCNHSRHLYGACNHKFKKLNFFTSQMMALKMLLILQMHLRPIISSIYSRHDEITSFSPASSHKTLWYMFTSLC